MLIDTKYNSTRVKDKQIEGIILENEINHSQFNDMSEWNSQGSKNNKYDPTRLFKSSDHPSIGNDIIPN